MKLINLCENKVDVGNKESVIPANIPSVTAAVVTYIVRNDVHAVT